MVGKWDEKKWKGGQRKGERGKRREMESIRLGSRLAVGSQEGKEYAPPRQRLG